MATQTVSMSTSQQALRSSARGFTAVRRPVARVVRVARARTVRVAAGWSEPEFASASIVSTEPAADGLKSITIDVGADAAEGYSTAGQFVQIKTEEDGKAAFIAIASAPGAGKAGELELLIKNAGGTAEALCDAPAGAPLLVSNVMGGGFPISKVPDAETVLLFATGSGISPVRALIESGTIGERKDVRLYYGAKSGDAMAYQGKFPEWEAAGVKVVPVFSGDDGFHVQDAYAKDEAVADAASTAVVLCGQKEMCEGVKEVLGAQGVPEDMFLTNF